MRIFRRLVKGRSSQPLKGVKKNIYFVMYRQTGKSHFIYKINDSVLSNEAFKRPKTLITSALKGQALDVYLDRFLEHLEKNTYKFDSDTGTLMIDREAYGGSGIARVRFGAATGGVRTKEGVRGGTMLLATCDESQDWDKDHFETVVLPQCMKFDAPYMRTGTAKPGEWKRAFYEAKKKMEAGDPDYYVLKWTILDGLKHKELTKRTFDRFRKIYSGALQYAWDAEMMCDFDAYSPGLVFAKEVGDLAKTGRIDKLEIDNRYPVDTFWDIGVNGTTCWIRQTINGVHHYLKYFEQLHSVFFEKFFHEKVQPYLLERNLKVRYNIFPHDMQFSEFMSPSPRIEVARKMLPGSSLPLNPLKNMPEVIDYTRRFFTICLFDKEGCYLGLERLQGFEYKGKGVKKDRNDPTTHGADAFMLSAMFTGDPFRKSLALNEFQNLAGSFDSEGFYHPHPEKGLDITAGRDQIVKYLESSHFLHGSFPAGSGSWSV